MSRVYQSDGRWGIDYVDVSGRRIRALTDAQTKTEARALLSAKLSLNTKAEILGVSSTDSATPTTLEAFYTEQYLPYAKTRIRQSSLTRKEQLAKHVLPFFGPLNLRAINAGHVERFMQSRANATPKPSPAEINRERSLLSSILNTAFRRSLVDSNPVARVRPLREDNALDRWLTPAEVERILDKAEAFVAPFIVVAVNTGMREGELTSLTWADLQASPGFIRVGQESKGHKVRYIPVNSAVKAVLDAQTHHIHEGRELPWVFVNAARKSAYRPDSVYHGFKRAAIAAKVEGVVFHSLRHSFASWAIQAGKSIAEVQQYLGHSSDTMTRRYAHLAPTTTKRNALEILCGGEVGKNPAMNVAPKGKAL